MGTARFVFLVKYNWLKLLLSLIQSDSTKVKEQNSDPISYDVIILLIEKSPVKEVFS